MSRPLNQSQLLAAAQKEYAALEKSVTALAPEKLTFSPTPGAWAVRDILAHLYEWQQMLLSWYESGRRGETPAVPAPGFKWSQLPALNQQIYEKYCGLAPERALALLRESHHTTLQFIETLPEADLTAPGLYPWMNRNTLLAYLNSTTAAHYAWAVKEIKKLLKA